MTQFLPSLLLVLLASRSMAFELYQPFRQHRVLSFNVVSAQKHEGVMCDACGMDPIVGPRFTAVNVDSIDICSVCATTPGQSFSADGLPFSSLTWRIVETSEAVETQSANMAQMQKSVSNPTPVNPTSTSEIPDEENFVKKAGTGATGRYFKGAPNAADYKDDKDFRKALYDDQIEKNRLRREKGNVGAQVSNDYINGL